ncbi:MAG: DUF255 domain-containing protein [Bacteroidetes bacterium]|nr:DUF255 domain-containing protein [Bacteroidota bacterium]
MKGVKIISFFLAGVLLFSSFVFFSIGEGETEAIKWHSFQEAVELSKTTKKKIFIDVYTDWCGWCKVMDKNTFTNPVIAKYMNEHFYAVKLNAEMKDTVVFNGTTFINPNPKIPRSTHQLAASLLNNKLSYPTTVYLDENFSLLTQVPGYLQPTQMEPILKYFGDNAYPNTKWEDYSKSFKGEITAPPPPVTPPSH